MGIQENIPKADQAMTKGALSLIRRRKKSYTVSPASFSKAQADYLCIHLLNDQTLHV